MACRPRGGRGWPPQQPNQDTRLRSLEDAGALPCEGGVSLVEDLADIADDIRQLATDFGARPYRAFSIIVSWDGGEVGKGDQRIESETEILPTPNVDISNIRYNVTTGGWTDDGFVKMYEVSPRYTQDEIRELFYRDMESTEQSFIEIRMDPRHGCEPVRHRFVVSGLPFYDATGFQWVVTLKVQQEERNRDGSLSERETTNAVSPLTLGTGD